MPGRLLDWFSRLNPKRPPENSLPLRLSVLASIFTAEITVLAMGYYSPLTVLAVPALTAAGFAFSWRMRAQRNLPAKAILSFLVIIAAVMFFHDLAASLYDTRLPLIKLLLWLQVLHSFDLPARKDLKFSLGSGLVLIAAGAVLSTGMMYAAGFILFSLAAAVSLMFMHASEAEADVSAAQPARPVTMLVYGALVWFVSLCVAVPVLLLLPQSTQARLHSLPLSSFRQIAGDFTSRIDNPSYSKGSPFSGPPQFDANSYYGFNQYMDLRARGQLSDNIVMKVRSDTSDYYRGVVFDRYNGKGWEISSDQTTDVSTDAPPLDLKTHAATGLNVNSRLETFYIESDLPNIIFSSWKPVSLYFPASRIKIDSYGSLRSPFPLTSDTVYSVMTEAPVYDPVLLRHYPRLADPQPAAEYTRLPDDPDLQRVQALARRVTRNYQNRYDQALAIELYLKDNYPYDLNVPPQTGGMDAVAYFLFEQRAGYCEHFASAMAVMARSIGIPARVVTGYAGGSYNPFTGLWEIRESDAHAWVEIYFGTAGWVPFDPTPGYDGPAAAAGESSWPVARIFSYIGGALASGPVGTMLGGMTGGLAAAANLSRPLPLALLVVAGLAILLAAMAAWRLGRLAVRRRRRRRLLAAMLGPDYLRKPLLKDYLALVAALDEHGMRRPEEETIRGFSARVSYWLSAEEFSLMSRQVEEIRYRRRKDGAADSPAGDPAPAAGMAELRRAVLEKLQAKSGQRRSLRPSS
ncbi:MAG: transglutaminase family protein [Thermoleophilia bacterium]